MNTQSNTADNKWNDIKAKRNKYHELKSSKSMKEKN